MSRRARCLSFLIALLPFSLPAADTTLAALAEEIRYGTLDAEACFEVREFTYRRGEMRLFFTDGYVIFRKPVQGQRIGAVFVAREELGDGEVLVIPPNRLERQSLKSFTGSPTLNEHYRLAAFTFTDGTGDAWYRELSASPLATRRPERGQLLREEWSSMVQNLSSSLETRLLEDLMNPDGKQAGLFFGSFAASQLGTFDLIFDGRSREPFLAGKLVNENGRSRYDIWMHFSPRGSADRPKPNLAARVEQYTIQAEFAEDLSLRARVAIDLVASLDGLTVVPLDVSPRLRIQRVTVAGETAEFYQKDALRAALLRMNESEQFLVRLPRPLKQGERLRLEVEEEGEIFGQVGNGVLAHMSRTAWFPQLGWQAAKFSARFAHPARLTLACPGERLEKPDAGRTTTECQVERPVRLFGIHLGEFEKHAVKREGLEVELYANKRIEAGLQQPVVLLAVPNVGPVGRRRSSVPTLIAAPPPPLSPLDRVPAMAGEIADSLAYFQQLFGPPPLARVVATPIPGNFGQGFPGLLYLSTLAYLRDQDLPAAQRLEWQERHFRDLLQAHEVAHQWWGNLVTFESYRDEWLAEALTNYAALLYLEKRKGAKAVDTVLEAYRKRLLAPGEADEATEAIGPPVLGLRIRATNPAAWHTIIYEKGSWILHMLRGRLGDQAFRQMLGALVTAHKEQPMTTEDLRQAAAARLPQGDPDPQLNGFFDTWVYGTGVPTLQLTHKIEGVGARTAVVLTLAQSKVDAAFEVDVPVEILLPRGKRLVRWIRSSNEPETLRVVTGARPLKVQLDPRFPVLRRDP